MSYQFQRIDLGVFDVHISLYALVDAALLKNQMAFLGSPDLYRKQYEQTPFSCGQFRMRPLRKKTRLYHNFWRYYATSFGKIDPWQLLLPFVCEPSSDTLSVVSPAAGVRAFVRPVTYLFPFGWANTLELSLQGKMSPAIVRDFVRMLRDPEGRVYQMGGKDLTLSGVFAEYSNRLKEACFVESKAAQEVRTLNRYVVMGISQFSGTVLPYKARAGGGPVIPAADKAMLHAMLLGRDVPLESAIANDLGSGGTADFLLTRYRDAGFAISYFDRGTLLFAQEAASTQRKPKVLHCLSSNALLCLMMMRSLLGFYNFDQTQAADPQSLLGQMRELAKRRLLDIPSRYSNALCQTWFKYYAPWRALKQVEKSHAVTD